MSEVSEILAEIEKCYEVVSNPNLVFSDKRNAYVDAGAILLPKIKALLESHAVIDTDQAWCFNDYCEKDKDDITNEQEDLVTAEQNYNYIQAELDRLTPPTQENDT